MCLCGKFGKVNLFFFRSGIRNILMFVEEKIPYGLDKTHYIS